MKKADIAKILETDPQTIFVKVDNRYAYCETLFIINGITTNHEGQTQVSITYIHTNSEKQLFVPATDSHYNGIGRLMINQIRCSYATTMVEAQEKRDEQIVRRERSNYNAKIQAEAKKVRIAAEITANDATRIALYALLGGSHASNSADGFSLTVDYFTGEMKLVMSAAAAAALTERLA